MRTSSTLALLSLALVACSDRSSRRSADRGSATTSLPAPSSASEVATTDAATSDAAALEIPGGTADIARSSNRFALNLWTHMPTGNLAISPISISTTLAILWGGAKGETASQLKHALQLEGEPDVLLSRWGALYKALSDTAASPGVALANRLYGDRSLSIDTTYFTIVRHAFDVWIEPVDFASDPEGTRTKINAWIGEHTANRITDLLVPGSIGTSTRFVLANAAYFRRDWAYPFDPAETKQNDFFVPGAPKRQVPTMHQTSSLRFARSNGASLVQLPYAGAGVSMYLLVPDARDGLAAVEKRLPTLMQELQAKLVPTTVRLALPRFAVAPTTPVELTAALSSLGIVDAFDAKRADLTNIAAPKSDADKLFASQFLHRALVEVDEHGTVAAAATAVATKSGRPPPPPVDLVADHPFLFVIADGPTGVILFIGRVVSP